MSGQQTAAARTPQAGRRPVRRTTALGARGESLAADFLARVGLRIIDRNVRVPGGELDLVAADGDDVVFVEVKTRVGDAQSAPDEAVTPAKLARIERLAAAYLDARGQTDNAWRIDVVAVVVDPRGKVLRIEHLKGAFL